MAQGPIYLNQASAEDLARLPELDDGKAQALVAARPFRSWQDVSLAEGVDQDLVNALKSAGAELGEPSAGPIGEPGSGGHGGSAAGNMGRA